MGRKRAERERRGKREGKENERHGKMENGEGKEGKIIKEEENLKWKGKV